MSTPADGLTHRVLGGFLWMAGGRGATAAAQFLVLAVLARLLTPADFGVVSAAMIVIGFSGIFSKLGLGPALVQRPHLEPRHLQTAATASILFGILIGVIIWAGAPLAAGFFRMPQVEAILRVLAWVFPLQGLVVVAESMLLKELQFRRLANLDVLCFTCGYGLVGIVGAAAGLGVWALVAGHIAQSLLKTTILLFISPLPRRLALERRAFTELMYFGGGLTAAKIANHIALDADNIVVGRWLGTAALGIYGRAYQLMAVPTRLFGTALDDVLFPILARVQGKVERLATGYRRSVALVAILMLPSSTVFFILAPELIYVVLGPGWEEVVGPFRVLAAGILLRTSYKMSDSIARSTGAVYRRAWRQFVYAILVIGGAWVGQHWGVVGVAFGVLGALVVNFVVMAQLGLDITRMSWWTFLEAHQPAALLSAVVGSLVWGLATMLRLQGGHPLANLILAGAGALVLVALLAWRAPGIFLGEDGRWFLKTLQNVVVGRLKQRSRSTGEMRTYAGTTAGATETGDN
jgi:PST family polysaccharide transporter